MAMSDQCRPELLQMDRLIRRRQLKGFDVPAVLQEMINGGAASLEELISSVLICNEKCGQMLQVLNVSFMPVIKKSSVGGYQSGLVSSQKV